MTKSVVMIANVFDAGAVLLAAGSTVTVDDSVANDLIGTGRARWPAVPTSNPATLTKEEVEATRGGGLGIVFASAALSASAVVKGVAGDPGNFVGILCTSVAGGKATLRNGGSVAGALISGLGDGGASGLTLTAGQYYSLGAAVYCPNGIFLEISGTGTYVCLYQ